MSLVETLTAHEPPLHMDEDGVVRVGGTRVTLDTLVEVYESGATPEEIIQAYDCLHLADVHAAISHYLRHRSDVDEYLSLRQAHSAQVRAENQLALGRQNIRQRLLSRRQKG